MCNTCFVIYSSICWAVFWSLRRCEPFFAAFPKSGVWSRRVDNRPLWKTGSECLAERFRRSSPTVEPDSLIPAPFFKVETREGCIWCWGLSPPTSEHELCQRSRLSFHFAFSQFQLSKDLRRPRYERRANPRPSLRRRPSVSRPILFSRIPLCVIPCKGTIPT